jgi:hypothetical protein
MVASCKVSSCKVTSCKVASCKVASCKVASCTGIKKMVQNQHLAPKTNIFYKKTARV